jgi:hypothetical protein
MIQVYGDFLEELPKNEQFLVINFSSSSVPVKQRWRNNGLSADFVADYLVTFFPTIDDDPKNTKRQAELKGAVSYVANELLENTLKYHDDTLRKPIQLGIHILEETVILYSINHVSSFQLKNLLETLEVLTTSDPEELYLIQLEKLADDDNSGASGMGLITIMHDYQGKLGWKIRTTQGESEMIELTTMVQLFRRQDSSQGIDKNREKCRLRE